MSIFYDGQPGPEVREQLNALYDAFAGSAYPPTAGMFAPGTLSAPSVRGTADPSTGWNLLNGEAQLSVGGALKARATAAGLLDAEGNPLLSAANAVGLLSQGAWCQIDRTAAGDVYRYADGRMRIDTPWVKGHAINETVSLPVGFFGYAYCIAQVVPVEEWGSEYHAYASGYAAFFSADAPSTENFWSLCMEGRWKA